MKKKWCKRGEHWYTNPNEHAISDRDDKKTNCPIHAQKPHKVKGLGEYTEVYARLKRFNVPINQLVEPTGQKNHYRLTERAIILLSGGERRQ